MEHGNLLPTGLSLTPTRADIVERISLLASRGPLIRGDHDHPGTPAPQPPLRAAAVLVPLVEREEGLTVLLTKRTDHLNDHAGQISFPGGRIEPDDADPEHAALREAREEIGLAADRVDLVGRLDLYRTTTGFEVVPVVGIVRPPFELRPDPFEVADVFEVPLAFILDPGNRELRSRMWKGQERRFYVLPYGERYIWGATAGMLVNLAQALMPEVSP